MSATDARKCIVGIQSCGCVTYVNSMPDQLDREDERIIARILKNGGRIENTTVEAAHAMPDFMPRDCPHNPKGWGAQAEMSAQPTEAFKLRVIVAQEPGHPYAFVVSGISEDTWGIIPPEEWDEHKREICEKWLGPDWTMFDFVEAVLDIPQDALDGLFSAAVPVTKVEAAE